MSLSAVALTWLTLLSYKINFDWVLLGFVFTAAITGYNFVLYAGLAKWHHRSLPKNLKLIQLFSLIAFMVMCLLLWFLPYKLWWWTALTGLLTLFYAIPVLPGGKNLRNVSGLKIGIIALVWSIVTVIYPLVIIGKNIEQSGLFLFLQRFLFILVLILPFEIRDLKSDALSLGTIPQLIGVRNTKILGMFILSLVLLLEYWLQSFVPNPLKWTNLLLIVLAVFLLFSNPKRSIYFTTFWLEAIPVIWLIAELRV